MSEGAGRLIGRYRLLRPIAERHAATVWLAHDTQQQRRVALKVLPIKPGTADAAELVQRFRREASALARLAQHPHVATISDVGQADDAVFLATEFIDGVSLDRRLTAPLDPALAVRIAAAVASALDAAHAAGILHRDVKPANVLIGHDGRIALTDFGFAAPTTEQGNLTKAGRVIGTTAYLAPEIIRGESASPASDQYGLGIVVYEMLTGQPPFRGANAMAVLRAHVQDEPPPPSTVRRGLPPAVDAVIARALAKAPQQRFPTCTAFATALAQALGQESVSRGAQDAAVRAGQELRATPHPPLGAGAASQRPVPPTARATLDALIRRVRELMLADDLDGAARALQAARRLAPDDPGVQQLEAELQQERRLAAIYEQARQHIRQEDWSVARELLNRIHAERPDHLDVAALRKQVTEELTKRWERQTQIQAAQDRREARRRVAQSSGAAAAGGAAGRAGPAGASGGGPAEAAGAGPAAAARVHAPPRVVDEAAIEEPQLQELVVRWEAAVAAASGRDWLTALYILESIERSIPELVKANQRLLLGVATPSTPLQKRCPKVYEFNDLLKRVRAMLGGSDEHPGVISYRRAAAMMAEVVGDSADGSFSLVLDGDHVVLTVRPAQPDGRSVRVSEVEAELGDWPLTEIDHEALAAAVAAASGQPVVIGTIAFSYREERGPAAGLGVVITPDEMRAYLVPTGQAIQAALTADEVHTVLARAGVVEGLQGEVVARFADTQPRAFPVTVAIGHPAEPGSPPRIVPALGDGQGTKAQVAPGTPLLKIERSDAGTPGRTVTGRELPPKSEPPPVLASYAGPGTKVTDDGQMIVAAVKGVVQFEGQRVSVVSPDADETDEEAVKQDTRQKVVPGRPVFGPGKKWVEISALTAQVAKGRAAELLGVMPDELEAREVGGTSARWRDNEAALRRTPKRYRVQPRSSDGRFALEAEQDGLYLTVWPAEGSGRPATAEQVRAELAQWPGVRIAEGVIEPIAIAAKGEPVRISRPLWLSVPCAGGGLGVMVSEDQMAAHVVALGALRRGPLDEGTVIAALAQAGVTHGIHRPELAYFCRLEERTKPYLLAVGTAPGSPSDEPEYLFPRGDRPPPEVRPGTMLAWLRSDTAAAGRTVTGKPVLPGEQTVRPLGEFVGEGTALEARPGVPGNQAIVAVVAGRPAIVGGRVCVMSHEYVAEPVRGQAEFDGSVTVAAAEAEAHIRARGDVTLESDAAAVAIEAGGSIRLRGVDGNGKARIEAGESVVASWLRGCLVMARDTIHVGTQLVQSTVMAARRVLVRGEGTINGGLVRATEEVVAQRILAGQEGNPTRIVLGKLKPVLGERSNARLVVHGEIEPGVRISIDGATLEVTQPIHRAVLRQRDGAIHIEPLAA